MNTKAIATMVFAVVLILAVLGITGYMTFAGALNRTKFTAASVWEQPFAGTQSMKGMDSGNGKCVVLQNSNTVAVLDADGKSVFTHKFNGALTTTFADIDGDNILEIVAVSTQAEGPAVSILNTAGEAQRTIPLPEFGGPARAIVLRLPSGTQIIAGDARGKLVSVSTGGSILWSASILHGSGDAIRGLDDVKVNGKAHLAVANHDGQIAVLDADGKALWAVWLGEDLRRMRAFDLKGDGKGQVIAGGDNGNLVVLDAETGRHVLARNVGQAVTEIREVETDGDPSSREFIVGGKKGGVWAYKANGAELWSSSLSEKVTEIAGLDVDDDGAEEVIVGDDGGAVNVFAGKTGARTSLLHRPSGIARIDVEKLTGSDQVIVADGGHVQLCSLKVATAPMWYSPILAGLLLSAIIAIVAWFIATAPEKAVTKIEAVDQSVEGLQSRRKMLHAGIADVERLRQTGEMASDAYLSRLKTLRAELADTEAALTKAGVAVRAETMKCPSCGGSVPLGTDRCEYCGQVVIG